MAVVTMMTTPLQAFIDVFTVIAISLKARIASTNILRAQAIAGCIFMATMAFGTIVHIWTKAAALARYTELFAFRAGELGTFSLGIDAMATHCAVITQTTLALLHALLFPVVVRLAFHEALLQAGRTALPWC